MNRVCSIVGGLLAIGSATAATVEAPSVISEKATFWLDAGDTSTIVTDTDGAVTAWTSKAGDKRVAVPSTKEGFLPPIYDTTTYGIPTVDLGPLGSYRDLTYTRFSDIRMVFMVVKIVKNGFAFLLCDSNHYEFQRGSAGEYGYGRLAAFESVWDMGQLVGWATDKIPDDSFRVICVQTSKGCWSNTLADDRGYKEGNLGRNGGKQLTELILFNEVLSDADRAKINNYLMQKWGLSSPGLTISGSPAAIGFPSPGYGKHTELIKGETYSFACSSYTNDSGTIGADCLGWSLLTSEGEASEGVEREKTMVYDETLEYGTLTWKWGAYQKLVPAKDYALPHGFYEVEYLEQGTGAYVDTGVKLHPNVTEVLLTVGASDEAVYSADQKWAGLTAAGGLLLAFGRYNSNWRIRTGGSWDEVSAFNASRGPLSVSIANNKWTFLDVSSEVPYEYGLALNGTKESATTFGLFAAKSGANSFEYPSPAGARIYGFAIYEDHQCAHKFVPCCRRRDKQPGFYDVKTGAFCESRSLPTVTGGTLIAGPRVDPIPGLTILIQ